MKKPLKFWLTWDKEGWWLFPPRPKPIWDCGEWVVDTPRWTAAICLGDRIAHMRPKVPTLYAVELSGAVVVKEVKP